MPKRVFQPGAQPRNSAFAQHMTVTHLQYSLAIREVACWWAATSKGNLWQIQRQHSICHTNKWVWPFWSVPFLVWLEGPPKGNHIFRNICIYINIYTRIYIYIYIHLFFGGGGCSHMSIPVLAPTESRGFRPKKHGACISSCFLAAHFWAISRPSTTWGSPTAKPSRGSLGSAATHRCPFLLELGGPGS